jgi:outer membrane receptor for ferrienterochelin and colicins
MQTQVINRFIYLLLALLIPLLSFGQEKKDSALDSLLNLDIDDLMETKVLIATKTAKNINEAPSVVSVITQEMIQNSGARTLPDILQYIPGFEFSMPRSGFYSVGIRGVKDPLTNARLLILKDGVPYNDVMYGTGLGMVQFIDLKTIKRIEVIRGPGSALYGRNAFSGVINIISQEASKKNEVYAESEIGNFNSYQIGATYGKKYSESFDFNISFDNVKSDLTDSKFDNGMGGEDLWNIGTNNLLLNSKINVNDFEINGYFGQIELGASVGPFTTQSSKKVQIGIYSVDYKKEISDHINFSAKMYGRNEDHTQHIEVYKPRLTAMHTSGLTYGEIFPNGAYATPSFKSYTYGVDANALITFFKKHSIMAGFQLDLYGLKDVQLKSSYDTYTGAPLYYLDNNGNLIWRGEHSQIIEERGWIEGDGHDYSNIGFYLQDVYTPIKNLEFTLGTRLDIDSEVGAVFNPRIGAVWNYKDLNVKVLLGQAYRAPNAQEQYRLTGFTIGNKNLKPETILTREVSIRYLFFNKLSTRVTFFHNELNDLIYSESSATGQPDTTYTNIGSNTSVGIETEISYKINNNYSLYANYSYNDSEDKVALDTIRDVYPHRDVAPHKVNAGFNARFWDKVNLNMNLMYRSEREKYTIQTNTGEIFERSQNNVGNYFLLNGKIRFINLIKNFELSIEAYNILDTEYYDQDNRNEYQPSRAGTNVLFGIKYRL